MKGFIQSSLILSYFTTVSGIHLTSKLNLDLQGIDYRNSPVFNPAGVSAMQLMRGEYENVHASQQDPETM